MSDNTLTSMFEDFTIMEISSGSPDDEGGEKVVYTEGERIDAFARFDSATEQTEAQRDKELAKYTIITPEDICLYYGQILKRLRDGKFFYLTSGNLEHKLPDMATIRIRWCTAEEYEIPEGASP